MDKLHIEVIRQIYEYDNTFNIKSDKVLKQLTAHCFIYNCRICFKPYNICCCYCSVYETYLQFCQQIYYDERSTYEDELKTIIALSGWFKNNIFIFLLPVVILAQFITHYTIAFHDPLRPWRLVFLSRVRWPSSWRRTKSSARYLNTKYVYTHLTHI